MFNALFVSTVLFIPSIAILSFIKLSLSFSKLFLASGNFIRLVVDRFKTLLPPSFTPKISGLSEAANLICPGKSFSQKET